MNQYTRYLTVLIAMVQILRHRGRARRDAAARIGAAVINPGPFFCLSCVITLVGGTMFLMWLGEQITSRGVGNGTSLIIFAGIVANLPQALANLLELAGPARCRRSSSSSSSCSPSPSIAFVVFMERAQRRVVIQYPKRQVGQRMFGGDSTHMPLKVNTSGVIPPIFASSHPADPGDHRRLLAAGRGRPGSASSRRSSPTASRSTWRSTPG